MTRTVASLMTLLALATSARAAQLTDDHGFALDLALPGTPACVVLPERLQRAEDCPGVDLAVMSRDVRAKTGEALIGMALVPVGFGDERARLLVLQAEAAEPTPEHVAGLVTGFLGSQPGAQARTDELGRKATPVTVADTPAFRVIAEGMTGAPGTVEVAYFVYGASRMYSLLFVTTTGSEAATKALATQLLAKVKLAPRAGGKDAAARSAYESGYQLGYLIGGPLVGLLFVGGILFWLFRVLLRDPKPPAGPPSPPPSAPPVA